MSIAMNLNVTNILSVEAAQSTIQNFGKFLNGQDILLTKLPKEHQELEDVLEAVEFLTADMDSTYGCINDMGVYVSGDADLYPHINEDEKVEEVKCLWFNWTKSVPEWAGCSKEDFISFVDMLSVGEDFTWEQALSLTLNSLSYSQRYGWEYKN